MIEIVTEDQINKVNEPLIDEEVLKKSIISDMSDDIVKPAVTSDVVE